MILGLALEVVRVFFGGGLLFLDAGARGGGGTIPEKGCSCCRHLQANDRSGGAIARGSWPQGVDRLNYALREGIRKAPRKGLSVLLRFFHYEADPLSTRRWPLSGVTPLALRSAAPFPSPPDMALYYLKAGFSL